MHVGCKCGQAEIVSKVPDASQGQFYVIIECEVCNYYWEGYLGFIE